MQPIAQRSLTRKENFGRSDRTTTTHINLALRSTILRTCSFQKIARIFFQTRFEREERKKVCAVRLLLNNMELLTTNFMVECTGPFFFFFFRGWRRPLSHGSVLGPEVQHDHCFKNKPPASYALHQRHFAALSVQILPDGDNGTT